MLHGDLEERKRAPESVRISMRPGGIEGESAACHVLEAQESRSPEQGQSSRKSGCPLQALLQKHFQKTGARGCNQGVFAKDCTKEEWNSQIPLVAKSAVQLKAGQSKRHSGHIHARQGKPILDERQSQKEDAEAKGQFPRRRQLMQQECHQSRNHYR